MAAKILDHSKAAFGQAIEYLPRGGSPEAFTGIFDEVSVQVDVEGEVTTQSVVPVCGVKLSDLSVEPREFDELKAAGKVYRIIDVQRDGRGGARLILHRVSG